MKPAFVLAIASFAIAASAAAQAPTTSSTPGPHDPNPPMNAPDLRLPPPCAPTPNLAANGGAVRPVATQPKRVAAGAGPIDSDSTIQCSANAAVQSAELPGLISPAANQ